MSQENVEIVRRLFEQWATGDLTADCFGPDIEYLRTGAKTPDMEGRWLGLDEVSTAMRDYLRAFSDLRIEAERMIDLSGNRVLVLSRHTARGAQSGVPIEHEIGDLFTLRDGKIVRYDSYWDRAEALEAAGLKRDRTPTLTGRAPRVHAGETGLLARRAAADPRAGPRRTRL